MSVVKHVSVRCATPEDGPLIGQLFKSSGKWEIVSLDWSKPLGAGWLIAEYAGAPVGCIQVLPGNPIARLELMCTPLDLPHRLKALTVITLLKVGLMTCKKMGAQFVAGMLHDGLDTYKTMIGNRGAIKWFTGDTYIKRVT